MRQISEITTAANVWSIPAGNLNLKLQLHPIVRKPHVRRQRGIGCLMRQVVANMSKKGALRFQPLDNAQRVLDGRMGGMRDVSQRIQKQDVEILQLRERGLRHAAVIGQISGAAEA